MKSVELDLLELLSGDVDMAAKITQRFFLWPIPQEFRDAFPHADKGCTIYGEPWLLAFTKRVRLAASGCWVWTGWISPGGYGYLRGYGRINWLAHRLAYVWAHGSIPTGLHVDHLCHNRACVNPEHLEAVTQKVNNQRQRKRLVALNSREEGK